MNGSQFKYCISNLWHTYESTKHKDNTDNDERFNCSESICFRDVAGDAVEDVDKHEEDCDEDCHSARDTLGGHEEADPGDDDEHAGGEVVCDDVVGHLPSQRELESCDWVVPWKEDNDDNDDNEEVQDVEPVNTTETLSTSRSSVMSTQ